MGLPELQILENVPLAPMTTFRVGGAARYLIPVETEAHIPAAWRFAQEKNLPFSVLGGGSNVVVADGGVNGVVLRMATRGIETLSEDAEDVGVRVAAGENWDRFVAHAVEQGWWGVENLSGIPGTAGAVPVQNVGAYGQEVADTIVRVEAWDSQAGGWTVLPADACGFGYRRSIFNTGHAGRYVVSRVVFRLLRQGRANTSHAAVAHLLERRTTGGGGLLCRELARRVPVCRPLLARLQKPPTLAQMRACILALRTDGRLPDVQTTGNAGSFFKNVVLDESAFGLLLARVFGEFGGEAARRIESIGRRFPADNGVKVPAGELVKLCGLQDARAGGAALHSANPVILVNATGAARAADILRLAAHLIRTVWERTGVHLEPEPRFIGFSKGELAALDPRLPGAPGSAGPGGGHA